MASVPRPLIALLLGSVVFFALWMTMLKPSSSSHPGLGQYQSAVNKACSVPGLAHPPGCGPSTSTPAPTNSGAAPSSTAGAGAGAGSAAAGTSANQPQSHAATSPKPGTHAAPSTTHAGTKAGFAAVQAGLQNHKVLALLFYNPSAADDRAVHQELATVPTHRGQVVKLAVPLQDLPRYSSLLNVVPVNFSPTLVLINRARQADEIMGFADAFEIDQRVAAALAG